MQTPEPYSGIIRGTYYPHIDGLRAIAVLSVIIYHAFPRLCPGGFMGVDIFFVISGYLITKGLANDLEAGQYSIGRFYVRRIRRILPAYSLMILFSLFLGISCYYDRQLMELARTALSSTVFATNIYFANTQDYFAANSHENPLLNLWSLSVEEQFYIFFPLILAFLHHRFRPGLKAALWGMAAISLAASSLCVFVLGRESAAFYWLPFRAWELLAGALLAICCQGHSQRRTALAAAALAVIVASMFAVSNGTPFPGATALPAVLGAVCLIYCGNSASARLVLENPVAVFTGRISYSLYLFHWPLLVYCRYAFHDTLGDSAASCLAVALSFGISWLSWKWIEMPFRKTRWVPRQYFATAAVILFFSATVSEGTKYLYVYEHTHPICKVEPYWDGVAPAAQKYADPLWEYCENRTPNTFTVLGTDENPQYVLWGDSHAMALAPGWNAFSGKTGINGLYINRKHTLLYDTFSKKYPNNAKWIDDTLTWLREHPELKYVVLANRWAVRAQGFTNEDGKPATYFRRDGRNGTSWEIFAWGLTQLCEELQAMGKKVVIVSSVPEQGYDVPSMLNRFGLFFRLPLNSIPYNEYKARQKEVAEVLAAIQDAGLAHVIWVDRVFYPNGKPIPLLLHNRSLYRDDDHLSPAGAQYLLEHICTEAVNVFGNRPCQKPEP